MWILIEVIAREISEPEFFKTYPEAFAEMKRRFDECVCSDYAINDHEAYGETRNHDDIDWKIFQVASM